MPIIKKNHVYWEGFSELFPLSLGLALVRDGRAINGR